MPGGGIPTQQHQRILDLTRAHGCSIFTSRAQGASTAYVDMHKHRKTGRTYHAVPEGESNGIQPPQLLDHDQNAAGT